MRLLFLCLILQVSNSLAQTADSVAPQQHYMLHCQGCHQADGSGLPGSVPSMRNLVGKFLAVPGGREYLVQVPGSSLSPLNDAELAELLNWLLLSMSAQNLPPDFQAYSESEVKLLRSETMLDLLTTRAAIVSRFPPEPESSPESSP